VNTSPDNGLPQRQNPAFGVHVQLGQSNIILPTINTDMRRVVLVKPEKTKKSAKRKK
jgi:hypothetical protein